MWTLVPRALIPLIFRIHSVFEIPMVSVGSVLCLALHMFSEMGMQIRGLIKVLMLTLNMWAIVFFPKGSKELINYVILLVSYLCGN